MIISFIDCLLSILNDITIALEILEETFIGMIFAIWSIGFLEDSDSILWNKVFEFCFKIMVSSGKIKRKRDKLFVTKTIINLSWLAYYWSFPALALLLLVELCKFFWFCFLFCLFVFSWSYLLSWNIIPFSWKCDDNWWSSPGIFFPLSGLSKKAYTIIDVSWQKIFSFFSSL